MSIRRPWSSSNSPTPIMQEQSSSGSISTTRSKKTTPEERVFGKGLFASYPTNPTAQTHGFPLYIFICVLCIVFSCILVILLITNILIQLRTIRRANISKTAVKVFYVLISILGIYALIVGNSWLFRKLSSRQERNSANAQYSSLNRLEENYQLDDL